LLTAEVVLINFINYAFLRTSTDANLEMLAQISDGKVYFVPDGKFFVHQQRPKNIQIGGSSTQPAEQQKKERLGRPGLR
jgi:hypothetical protein